SCDCASPHSWRNSASSVNHIAAVVLICAPASGGRALPRTYPVRSAPTGRLWSGLRRILPRCGTSCLFPGGQRRRLLLPYVLYTRIVLHLQRCFFSPAHWRNFACSAKASPSAHW